MASKRTSENKIVGSTSAAAAPARRQSVSKRIAARTSVETSITPVSKPEIVAVAAPAPVAVSAESHRDAVARLAYSFWEARGYQGGSPETDWLRAELEISAK